MNALEYSTFDNPKEFDISDVVEAFKHDWNSRFQNFAYSAPALDGLSDQEIVLTLARGVINLASDYKRVATILHTQTN